jgi:hypothetical protein
MVYHRGMAEELGITEAALEAMTLAQLCREYRKRGIRLEPRDGGDGPGLTLRDQFESEQVQR